MAWTRDKGLLLLALYPDSGDWRSRTFPGARDSGKIHSTPFPELSDYAVSVIWLWPGQQVVKGQVYSGNEPKFELYQVYEPFCVYFAEESGFVCLILEFQLRRFNFTSCWLMIPASQYYATLRILFTWKKKLPSDKVSMIIMKYINAAYHSCSSCTCKKRLRYSLGSSNWEGIGNMDS